MVTAITQTPAPLTAPTRLRVAAYARISETKGNMPGSLSAQVSYYNQVIAENPEWEFAGVFTDAGESGTSTHRHGFQSMLAACDRGEIDLILTKSISRFARNTVDLLRIVRKLRAGNIEVIFERENIHTLSGDGELMLSILASFAQEEAWSTSANVKWGIRKNFEKGITNQMRVYGYTWTGSEFIINEPQAKAVRYIYKRFLEGARYADIIRECEQHGWQAYWGGRFSTAALKMILSQERYTGNTLLGKSFNPYPGHHGMKNTGQAPMYFAEGTNPVIIDQETFDRAQVALAERTAQNRRYTYNQTPTVFSGRIWCGVCDKRANRCHVGWKENPVYGWRCANKAKLKPASCSWGSIREDRLKEITCLLTGAEQFSDDLFTKQVRKVVMPADKTAIFHMRDGRVFNITFTKGRNRKPLTPADITQVQP